MLFYIIILGVAALLTVLFFIKKKRIDRWLLSYCQGLINPIKTPNKPIDLMFIFVDHFELNGHEERLTSWTHGYPRIAAKHKDSDGRPPSHTFFYALDLMHEHELAAMQPVIESGFGEMELHWHHQHESETTFIAKLDDAMKLFHHYGYMRPYKPDQDACFGFIHGNWSLANSRGDDFCGLDNEVKILKNKGCYADFTYPALFSEAQPPTINSIYYCNQLDSNSCYFKGRISQLGYQEKEDEFMIFQGPMTINWLDWRHKWHPTIEDGDINNTNTHSDPKRIDAWVRQAIHVKGKPEWQFVKVFCHGGQDHESVVSTITDDLFSYLEKHYNDGTKYRLHYVSTREAYNIVRAAEAGEIGNPNLYRDHIIPHPLKRNKVSKPCVE